MEHVKNNVFFTLETSIACIILRLKLADRLLELTILAYNILRMIGQESLGLKDTPMKHNVRRRRLRTVISNLVMMASHVTEHARRIMIGLGQSNVWRFSFSRIYTAFADFSL